MGIRVSSPGSQASCYFYTQSVARMPAGLRTKKELAEKNKRDTLTLLQGTGRGRGRSSQENTPSATALQRIVARRATLVSKGTCK